MVYITRRTNSSQSLVRDLWALRLQKLQTRTTHDSETETEGQSSQVFSSQSESASGTESRSSRKKRRRDQDLKNTSPSLVETLALCYIGGNLLRIPLTVADINRWVNDGELLYYRAHREVPLGMRERLPGEYERQLEPQVLLQPQVLHQRVSDTVKVFGLEFGMAFPPINTSLVLFRWIKDLMLPLEIFVASQRLARSLRVDFTFGASSSCVVLRYPEASLMAFVVVATKLLLPFDDIERHPLSINDLSTMSMDWNEWKIAQESGRDDRSDASRLTYSQAFSFLETDCFAAADEKLDSYLAWYAENVASDEVREGGEAGKDAEFRRTLFGMFPLDARPQPHFNATADAMKQQDTSKLRTVQERLVPRAVVEPVASNKDTARLGSSYRRFRQVEDLSGVVEVFYVKAAKVAGLSLDGLVQAVFSIERQMQKQEEALRKAARADGQRGLMK